MLSFLFSFSFFLFFLLPFPYRNVFINNIPKDTQNIYIDGNAIKALSRHSFDGLDHLHAVRNDYINSEAQNITGAGFDYQKFAYGAFPFVNLMNPILQNVKMPLNESKSIMSSLYYICPAGTYNDRGSGACKVCPKGRYNDDSGRDLWHHSLTTAENGVEFIAGSQLDKHDSVESCKLCPAGTYLDDDATVLDSHKSITNCIGCIEGRYSAARGVSSLNDCLLCAAGKYSVNLGAKQCLLCDLSTFQKTKGSTSCTLCTRGQYQNEQGATACQSCPLGYTGSDQQNCVQCSPGKYSDEQGLNIIFCKDCSPGQYQNEGGSNFCLNCQTGQYTGEIWENSKINCDLCPSGSYNTEEGKESSRGCISCNQEGGIQYGVPLPYGRGETTLGACVCAVRLHAILQDDPRLSSYELDAEQTKLAQERGHHCGKCPRGGNCNHPDSFSLLTLDELNPLIGHWRSDSGSSDFINCNEVTGVTDETNPCCPIEQIVHFNSSHDGRNYSKWSCTSRCRVGHSGPMCMVCSSNGGWMKTGNAQSICDQCIGGGSILPSALALFASFFLFFIVVFVVLMKVQPPKERRETEMETEMETETKLKSETETETKSESKSELESESKSTELSQKKLVSTGKKKNDANLASHFLSDQLQARRVGKQTRTSKKNLFSKDFKSNAMKIIGRFKIQISALQITSMMTSTFDSVPWPDNFSMFTASLQIFNVDILDFFPFMIKGGCIFRLKYTDKFLLHMLIPIGLYLFAWLAYLVAGAIRTGKQVRLAQREWYVKMVTSLVLLIYPGLTVRIFQMFKCYPVPGFGGSVLHQDFSMTCYEGQHNMYIAMAVVAMVVYVFGIPLAILFVLFKNKAALFDETHSKHEEVAMEFGSLYIQYVSFFFFGCCCY